MPLPVKPIVQTLPLPVVGKMIRLDFKENGLCCRVEGISKPILPLEFSFDFIKKVFPPKRHVLFGLNGGCAIPIGVVEEYTKDVDRVTRNVTCGYMRLRYSPSGTQCARTEYVELFSVAGENNGSLTKAIIPCVELFEINVTGDMYTYILAFPGETNGAYMRTPLIKKVAK